MATKPYTTPYFSEVQARRRRASDDLMSDPSSENFLSDLDYSSLVSGGLGLAGTYMGIANQGLGLTAPPDLQRSATGEPIYNLGSSFNQAALSQPQGASGGEILSGAGQGAAAGSAFGPIGTGVGAVVGGLTSVLGGNRRKRKQRAERRQAMAKIRLGQQDYNKASESFNTSRAALSDYRQRQDISDQIYNLYRYK